ncbi:AbrB/MazE/SpoVT family DNA-binding domain-containing protein [Candidatus Woesearchaeota archaeon]|nr:AbrB/MazE/SpoVT family DNA-binding domain-containing protein [Candidatus Woesearchaeota archaeon]
MERRKVIKQGKGTLTMSLPMQWIKQLRINAGDEIEVEHRGMQLIVGPGRKQSKKTTEIDISGFCKGLVYVLLNNSYIRGDDEIKITFETPEQYEALNEGIKQLLGFEIVEQTKNTCVVKELAKGDSEDFETLLRRIFLILLSIAEEGCTAMQNNDMKTLNIIQKRDENINVLVNYSLRMLNKKGGADINKSMHYYALLLFLEQLGDQYARLYRDVKKISTKTTPIMKETAQLIRTFYELFYKFEKQKANNLKNKRD